MMKGYATIKRTSRFYQEGSDEFNLRAESMFLSGCGRIIGLYVNPQHLEEHQTILAICDDRVRVCYLKQYEDILYKQMTSVSLKRDDKGNPCGVRIGVCGLGEKFIPVGGNEGKYYDAFQFVRFLDKNMSVPSQKSDRMN